MLNVHLIEPLVGLLYTESKARAKNVKQSCGRRAFLFNLLLWFIATGEVMQSVIIWACKPKGTAVGPVCIVFFY